MVMVLLRNNVYFKYILIKSTKKTDEKLIVYFNRFEFARISDNIGKFR